MLIELGAIPYQETVVQTSDIAKSFKHMHEKDKQNMQIKFNMEYYLAKHDSPFSDYNGLLKHQTKNNVPEFGKSYLNDKAAAQFTDAIAKIEKENLHESLSKD